VFVRVTKDYAGTQSAIKFETHVEHNDQDKNDNSNREYDTAHPASDGK
jgi:hypothetical protein